MKTKHWFSSLMRGSLAAGLATVHFTVSPFDGATVPVPSSLVGFAREPGKSPAAPKNAAAEAVVLVNCLMTNLAITDADKRLKAILPLVHKSLLNEAGNDLEASVKDYSYKKAVNNAGLYQVPVQVTRVSTGRASGVGFGETAEEGRTDRYFVAKRKGVSGSPAPIHVFFPKSGGKPKIINVGSL